MRFALSAIIGYIVMPTIEVSGFITCNENLHYEAKRGKISMPVVILLNVFFAIFD